MSRILLNADIGERGPDQPVDRVLMGLLDIANIACGGHAGDAASVSAFRELAGREGARTAAHLSYPDKDGFGRTTIDLPFDSLRMSLDAQFDLMPDARIVKFHGALYNDSCSDARLASRLCTWLRNRGVMSVITLAGSALAVACTGAGIEVLAEAFAERRYVYSAADRRLLLVSRKSPHASITDLDEAVRAVRTIVEDGRVHAFVDHPGHRNETGMFDIVVDTICIHSDSPIAVDLARAVREILGPRIGGLRGNS
jgi:UPF0271 protein